MGKKRKKKNLSEAARTSMDFLMRRRFRNKFYDLYSRWPSEEELKIFNKDSTVSPQKVLELAEKQRAEQLKAKAKKERKPCGGIIRAERANAPAVLIKNIEYVPISCSSINVRSPYAISGSFKLLCQRLTNDRPHLFLPGVEHTWCVSWLADLFYVLVSKMNSYDEMLAKIDKCSHLTGKARDQFVLDETMVFEYE